MKNQYQSIPRKYRPQRFCEVVGQDAIVQTLKNGLVSGKTSHAYLFSGCRGTGKTTLARVLAKALNCDNLQSDGEPCNTCGACSDVVTGRNLDILEIDGASNRGIDDIRQINETVGYAAASGKYKIYIIDEVHMLTKEAFNALLKTLEEPPKNVKFFFATTESHKVPPTIISRCQRFDLNRITIPLIVETLGKICADLGYEADPAALRLIAAVSDGALRDAQSLLDQMTCFSSGKISADAVSETLGLMPKDVFFQLDEAIHTSDLLYALKLTDSVFSGGHDLAYFLDELMEHYRSHLHLKLNGSLPEEMDPALTEKFKESGKDLSSQQCLYILDFLVEWNGRVSKAAFKRVNLEIVLMGLIRSKNRLPVEQIAKRLISLESGHPQQNHTHVEAQPKPPQQVIAEPVKETPKTVEPPKGNIEEKCAEKVASEAASVETKQEDPQIKPSVESATKPPKFEEKPTSKEDQSVENEILKRVRDKIAKAKQEKLEKEGSSAPSTPPPQKPQVENNVTEKKSQKVVESPKINVEQQQRYDTIMRFAAVELEGSVKK